MAYETIADFDCTKTISVGGTRLDKKTGKRYKNPTQIEGFYVGTKSGIDNKLNPEKPMSIHIFQTAEGNVGVWGKTDLDQKMRRAKVGYMTLVAFDKMVPTNRLPMFKYTVQQDPQNVNQDLVVGCDTLNNVQAEESTSSFESEEEAVEEEAFEEEASLDSEEAVDEPVLSQAQAPKTLKTPDPDRLAQTRRLLGGKKTA